MPVLIQPFRGGSYQLQQTARTATLQRSHSLLRCCQSRSAAASAADNRVTAASDAYTVTLASSAIRANPCPEVTDPFCRLPLPTLFYRPEAVNLGDLLRIWVRLAARVTSRRTSVRRLHHALTFSRAGTSASDTTRAVVLLGTCVPISG